MSGMNFALCHTPSISASGNCAKGCVIMLQSPPKSRGPFNGTPVKDGSTPEMTDVTHSTPPRRTRKSGTRCTAGARPPRSPWSFPDRFDERPVVALILVGIFDCELANSVIKGRIRAHMSCNTCGVSLPCVRPRQMQLLQITPVLTDTWPHLGLIGTVRAGELDQMLDQQEAYA